MNIKLLTLSAAAATFLVAASPMVSTSMSTDNGGTKKAIDAYSDGAGVLIINQASDTKFDNSTMNKLVFKYGDAAKSSNTTLKNQVTVLSTTATAIEKSDAASKIEIGKVAINPPVNGTGCNDFDPQTITDVWANGVCEGNNVEGLSCDDTNTITFADKYTNGVCAGVTDGTTCNDNNTLTFADKYTSGVCAGVTNGTICNDGYSLTTSDIYTNGVCAGSITGCQIISTGTCTSCLTGYTLSAGKCLQNITLSGNKWSDGTTSPTCWEYYNGKTTSTKKYLPQTASVSYLLTDGRTPTCNMPALAALHNSGDWAGFFSFNVTNCLAYRMYTANEVFLHPQPTVDYCTGTFNANTMFKTVSFYIKHINVSGDGAGWQFYGAGVPTQTAAIAPNTSTPVKTVSPTGAMYIQTNAPSGLNEYDHTFYVMTGYTE